MAVPTQTGTSLEIGFKGYTWTGYVVDDGATVKKGYNDTVVHKDTDGATRTKIRMDEYEEQTMTVTVDVAGEGEDDNKYIFTDGDTVEVMGIGAPGGETATTWEVNDASTSFNREALKVTLTLLKEASMDYSSAE